MFTIEQIHTAHSKVKSGADFPAYIQELKIMEVKRYETFVEDGHTVYFGVEDYRQVSPAKYDLLTIAKTVNKEQFLFDLKAHQQGKTDYPTFCQDTANAGIEKWMVCMEEMTCTYVDQAGNKIVVEVIPN